MDKDDEPEVPAGEAAGDAGTAEGGDAGATEVAGDAGAAEGGDAGASGAASERPIEAFVSGAAYASLGLLGALVGVVGAFAHPWSAWGVPVAGIALIAINFGLVRLAGWALGGRLGAAVPALLWAAVTFTLSVERREGDLIIPGTFTGYLFIVGGLVAVVVAVSLVPSRRPPGQWLTGGVPFARG